MGRRHGALAFQGEVVQPLHGRPQVLPVKVKDERLADRDNQAVVSATEHVLELVGRVGGRLRILFEPVGDLIRGSARVSISLCKETSQNGRTSRSSEAR